MKKPIIDLKKINISIDNKNILSVTIVGQGTRFIRKLSYQKLLVITRIIIQEKLKRAKFIFF